MNLHVERIGKEREDAVHPLGGGLPIAHAEVGLRGIVEHDRVTRINRFRVLVFSDRSGPIPSSSLDGGDIETDVTVTRQDTSREIELTQR